MPSPSTVLTTLSRELGLYYEARLSELRADYIADMVFPVKEVRLQSATFKKIPIEEILNVPSELRRAPSSAYWRSTFQFTEDTYQTYDRGNEDPIDDSEQAAYSDFIDLAQEATQRVLHKILQDKEMRVAAALMDVATYTGTGSLNQAVTASTWNVTSSKPITDVRLAADKMFANVGIYPNTLVISRPVFRALQVHPDVINAITSAGAGDQARVRDITRQQMAAVFDVDSVVVGGGAKRSSTISHIWGNHAMVCQVATSGDMREPCIGRQFHWAADGSSSSGTVEVYREENTRSNVVRARMHSGEKRIHTEMACMVPNVLP